MNQTESWMDFPEGVCTLNTDQSFLEKHKCCSNVRGLSEQTLKILPVHYIVRFSAQAVSCTLFLDCFFVGELALTHFPWSTVYETQSLQYIPYPSPPATSTPDSLWSWICVWGNAMDKQPVQYRLKSFHLTVSLHRQMHRLTQSVVSKGFVKAFHGVCRCKINFPVWFMYIKHPCCCENYNWLVICFI